LHIDSGFAVSKKLISLHCLFRIHSKQTCRYLTLFRIHCCSNWINFIPSYWLVSFTSFSLMCKPVIFRIF